MGHAPAEVFPCPAATKEVAHRAPCIENNVPGTAFKVINPPPYTAPTADEATKVQIGEAFEIEYTGEVEVDDFDAANTDVGDAVYIDPDNNALTLTNSADVVPYGRIVRIDPGPAPDRLTISLDLRDTVPVFVAP